MTITEHDALFAGRDAAQPAWLRAAADAARVGFWHLDLESGNIDCTQRCKANLGIPPDANVTIDTIWHVMHPDDRETTGVIVQKAIESRGDYAIEYRAIWPDGSVHWISSRGRYVEVDGRASLVGTTIDDSERRRVEELNRLITSYVAEGICFMDPQGRLTFMNAAAEKILGWTFREVSGRMLHDVVHYKRPDGTPFPIEECALGATLAGTAIIAREDQWIHKDGQFISVVCSSVPIAEEGRIAGAVVSLHDITERKRMENALREAGRAKDEFLATVSHELRTPMTAILGWAQLLETMELTPELRTAIEQIELSAKAQAAIVDDLIDVSRAITGKLRLHVSRIDVAEVVREVTQMVDASAAAKRIKLSTELSGTNMNLIADRGRLHQVFWNLLSNAIKFTPTEGAVQMRVAATDRDMTVVVRDSGIGIQPEFLPYVFDRFSQQSGATTRMHGGLGLGLSIVKQLVEMHGGTVTAESEGAGKGATFTVVLPRL
ncbi:MAG: ATP-binding protein [Acidobacteriota bacterium]|nr:ATP-binding protein [Acidobacteriota bacterium]